MKKRTENTLYNVWFRLSPFIIVIVVELLLTLFGAGQNYRLFLPVDGDRDSLRLNTRYATRYYSREQFQDVRLKETCIAACKDSLEYRIFFIGDHSCINLFSERQVNKLCESFTADNGRKVRVVPIVIPYANSFAVNGLARDLKKYSPDALIVMTGMSEFYGLPRRSNWLKDINNYTWIKWYTRLKKYRIVQILESFLYVEKEPAQEFPPRDMDHWIVPYLSEKYVVTKSFFQRNLRYLSRDEACPVFLLTLPIHYTAPPVRSVFVDDELRDKAIVMECETLLNSSDPYSIQRWLDNLEAWEPGTAAYYYCRARAFQKNGDSEAAMENYLKARENDGFRSQMQSGFNQDIRNACRLWEYELVDMEAEFMAESGNGLSVDRFFTSGSRINSTGMSLLTDRLQTSILQYFNR